MDLKFAIGDLVILNNVLITEFNNGECLVPWVREMIKEDSFGIVIDIELTTTATVLNPECKNAIYFLCKGKIRSLYSDRLKLWEEKDDIWLIL